MDHMDEGETDLLTWADWIIHVNDIDIIRRQPIYLITQLVFFFGALTTFLHAYLSGKKWVAFWISCVLNGLLIEAIFTFIPSIQNFWHSQALIMILGSRIPLHVILSYACLYYCAMVASSRMNLSPWAEIPAVGMIVILLDVPFDLIGVKFVQWTWHETDPNIRDRSYFVPWVSYIFHFIFPAVIFATHRSFVQNKTTLVRVVCSTLFSIPVAMVTTNLVYHPLREIFNIHTKLIVFGLHSIALVSVWANERQMTLKLRRNQQTIAQIRKPSLLIAFLTVYYLTMISIAIYGNPADEISRGYHQAIGPCNVDEPLYSIFNKDVRREKYLCSFDKQQEISSYSFNCEDEAISPNQNQWYTICGRAFENRTEYIAIICTISYVAFVVFWNTLLLQHADTNILKRK